MTDQPLETAVSQTENWRRYAAWELVQQAVRDMKRNGDITGKTTEKMKKLFPEIKNGWEKTLDSHHD